jgi:predicted DNA-binding transcriptional regulator YafY
MEITPWIRSWGPDVEVLEPNGLREQFKMFAEQQYRLYCMGNS